MSWQPIERYAVGFNSCGCAVVAHVIDEKYDEESAIQLCSNSAKRVEIVEHDRRDGGMFSIERFRCEHHKQTKSKFDHLYK